MDYYRLLQLEREPFSNSPDPAYFFQSRRHADCLHRIELALRLKRGLNVVIGDVGTGKTTLCRELIRRFAGQPDVETHLILDPAFESPSEFLALLGQMLSGARQAGTPHPGEIKEQIKQALFSNGIDRNRITILIIDEGQKIPPACIEPLRELLNFETNTYKLLQIVIFAQPEFESILRSHANFSDRINLLHHLGPMDFRDTRQMIQYRLRLAGGNARPRNLFTLPAIWSIYRASRGYPRQVIHLCHQSVLAMIIQNRTRAGWNLIRSCRKRLQPKRKRSKAIAWVAAGSIALAAGGGLLTQVEWGESARRSEPPHFKVPDPVRFPHPASDTEPSRPEPSVTPQSPAEPTAAAVPEDPETPGFSVSLTPSGFLEAGPAAESDGKAAPIHYPPPQTLGTLAVQPGDTLASMVRKVYGEYRPRLIRAVLQANPGILDPDTIEIGMPLVFPAVPFAWARGSEPAVAWIILHEGRELPGALRFQSTFQARWGLPSRLVAIWTPESGLRFNIALFEPSAGYHQAQARCAALPAETVGQAQIVTAWPRDAQLYSILSYTAPFRR